MKKILAGCVCFAVIVGSGVALTHAEEARAALYSFPAEIKDVNLGRAQLLAYAEGENLRADDVPDRLFDSFPPAETSNVVRRLLQRELGALAKELELPALAQQAKGNSTDAALAAWLDKQGKSERDVQNALRKAFEDYYLAETLAYFVQQGYNENWMLARLKRDDGPQDSLRRVEDFERQDEKDRTRTGSLWSRFGRDLPLNDQLALLMGMADVLRPALTKAFSDQGVAMTPEIERVVGFGDPVLLAQAVENAGVQPDALTDAISRVFDDREDGGQAAATGNALLARLLARERASMNWLCERWSASCSVYEGKSSTQAVLPVLGPLEGKKDDWKAQPDLGISTSLAGYFSGQLDTRLVLHDNGSVRALIGNVRYEGYLDKDAGTLSMVAVYGGTDRRFKDIKLHAEGLLLELAIPDAQPDKSRTLLRRTRNF